MNMLQLHHCFILVAITLKIIEKNRHSYTIQFEAITPSIKKNFFHQRIVNFVNIIQFSDQKYKTNGTVRYEKYKGKFLFTMKGFLSFGTYLQSMCFMSARLLKYNIDGVCVPQFQLGYIHNTTHPLHKSLVKLCSDLHQMWWGKKLLKLQKWEYLIKSKKTIILAIIVLVTKKKSTRIHIICRLFYCFFLHRRRCNTLLTIKHEAS